VAQTAQPLYWTYRIQVRANNNVHWQPPEGDIEFSVDLDVEQTPEQLILFGEMRAVRGTYWFLSNRFRVERADLTFDHVTGVDPMIDAEATTRMAASDSVNGGTEVRVLLSGRASEPTIRFESDPPHDEAWVLEALTLGGLASAGTTAERAEALGDPLDNYLTRALNRTLSEEMSRVFRGYISQWELERERGGLLAGEGDVILGVGTQVTPQLSLRYRERIPGTGRAVGADLSTELFNRDIEAEYRLSRLIYITSGVRQRRSTSLTTGSTVGTDFNVNLKARWEY
jgi:translocation and assembly module TamB